MIHSLAYIRRKDTLFYTNPMCKDAAVSWCHDCEKCIIWLFSCKNTTKFMPYLIICRFVVAFSKEVVSGFFAVGGALLGCVWCLLFLLLFLVGHSHACKVIKKTGYHEVVLQV